MTEIAMSDLQVFRGIAWQDLHPIGRLQFVKLAETLTLAYTGGATKTWFRPHMGYRSPVVQDGLYAQGRTKPGAKVTNAQGWESAHQYGLAVDFVPWQTMQHPLSEEQVQAIQDLGIALADSPEPKGRFIWTEGADWKFLKSRAEMHGLTVPIKWDRPHVEHPAWTVLKGRIRGG